MAMEQFRCPAGNDEPGGEPCVQRLGGLSCGVRGIVEASGGKITPQELLAICLRRRRTRGGPPSPLNTPKIPRA